MTVDDSDAGAKMLQWGVVPSQLLGPPDHPAHGGHLAGLY